MMVGENVSPLSPQALSPVATLIDDQPLSGYQVLIIGICGLIAMLDGFDTQAIGFVAPAIAASLKMHIESFGPVFASGLFGGLLGALLFGRVADRFGRKPTILTTLGVIACGTLLTVESQSAIQLLAVRFLTGLGLGGALPSIIAICAEYAPHRLRSTLVTAMFCGFPLGAVVGGAAAARLLLSHDWHVLFIVGGAAPVLLFPVVWLALPESIRWLAVHHRNAAIGRVLARMHRREHWDGRTGVGSDSALVSAAAGGDGRSGTVARLFESGRHAGTLLLWLTFFLSLLLVYLLVSWIPTLAQQGGRGAGSGAFAAAVLNLGGIAGSAGAARLSDRFGPYTVVSASYFTGAALVLAIGLGTPFAAGIYWFAATAGLFCIGAQLCVVALASEFYPVELRATGVGWAVGVGRIGAITGPLVGSLLIGAQSTHFALFAALAAISAAAGAAILTMGHWAAAAEIPDHSVHRVT
jgi:MFS transporter, AAHS family, 4-hydroxybenzoate transporter